MGNKWAMAASLLLVAALLAGCAAQQQRQIEPQPAAADAASDAGQPSLEEPGAGQPPAETEKGAAAQPPAGEQPAEPDPEIPAEPVPEVKEFRVEAFRFGFEPSRIEVDRGDTVRITAVSTDVTHGLAISGYGVKLRLEPGVEQVAEFVADTPGEFTFYCSVPCGSGHSTMRGTFIVK